jgi:hypothetical protein
MSEVAFGLHAFEQYGTNHATPTDETNTFHDNHSDF